MKRKEVWPKELIDCLHVKRGYDQSACLEVKRLSVFGSNINFFFFKGFLSLAGKRIFFKKAEESNTKSEMKAENWG